MSTDIISGIAYIYNESALYILFGFLLAGVLKIAFSPDKVLKHLGGKNMRSVLLVRRVIDTDCCGPDYEGAQSRSCPRLFTFRSRH